MGKENHNGNKSFDDEYSNNKEMFGHPYKELQEYFINYPLRGKVLDLGCGQGRDSIFLASIGFEVTAVDSSEVGIKQMIDKAHEKGVEVEGIFSDVLKLQLDKKFDVILFDMLLHSFEKSVQFEILKKFSVCLNDNGVICIVYPDDLRSDHFMDILNSFSNKWVLKDEIVIKDVPKIPGEEGDYIFHMIIVKRK